MMKMMMMMMMMMANLDNDSALNNHLFSMLIWLFVCLPDQPVRLSVYLSNMSVCLSIYLAVTQSRVSIFSTCYYLHKPSCCAVRCLSCVSRYSYAVITQQDGYRYKCQHKYKLACGLVTGN